MKTAMHYLELAYDEAERELYRAARECTDTMRAVPGEDAKTLEAKRSLIRAATVMASIGDVYTKLR